MLKSSRRRESNAVNLTVIGSGMNFKGKIFSSDDIRVDGNVEGEIVTKGRIVVGKSGYVNGYMKGTFIIVEGRGEGDFVADNEFTIAPEGYLVGTIRTKNVNIKEKAFFDGNCYIIDEQNPVEKPKRDTSGNLTEKEKQDEVRFVNNDVVKPNGKDVSSVTKKEEDENLTTRVTREDSLPTSKPKSSLLSSKMKQIRSI